jgi:hypothetical protein
VLALVSCGQTIDPADQKIATAESFVDAFYSFEQSALREALKSAESSVPSILYYQGWAEGGNYTVINRMPCSHEDEVTVECSITVEDDLMGALGIEFNVTDTFHLTFSGNNIAEVTTSSNDPQAYYDAEAWVRKLRPELIAEPCQGFFDGGPTPGDCVRAMVHGYSGFAASGELMDSPQTPE